MKEKVTFAPKKRNSPVQVEAEPIVIDLGVPLDDVARAAAQNLKDLVDAQPGNRWNKTGTLHDGIKAERNEVTIPGNRLNRPELVDRFQTEVMRDPFLDKRVLAEVDRLLARMLGER